MRACLPLLLSLALGAAVAATAHGGGSASGILVPKGFKVSVYAPAGSSGPRRSRGARAAGSTLRRRRARSSRSRPAARRASRRAASRRRSG